MFQSVESCRPINNTKKNASKPEIYIESAPNNSNETYTFMCLGELDVLVSAKTTLKFKYEI